MSKNYLESIICKVYQSSMDPAQQIELLSRTVDILALDLAFDHEANTMEILAKQEEVIGLAKIRAMQDMGILDR